MGTTLSQIEYWRGINKPDNKTNNINNTPDGGREAIYLSYDIFLGLTVLGGLFALDHLYLRSPLTFIAKIVVNMLTMGTWWLYDASHAIFNRNVVKVFGLGVPGLGPKGIAAGVLASDIPDKKHMSFFIYALALFIGGIFGLDSFILGDKQSGYIRLICLITFILAPVAILWWLYNTGLFLFKTKDVINKHWEYFGAPPPLEHGMSIGEKLLVRFPILQTIVGPISTVKSVATTATQIAKDLFEDPVGIASSTVQTVAKPVINAATTAAKPVINAATTAVSTAASTAVAPIMPMIDTGLGVAKQGLDTVHEGLSLGKTALNTGSTIASQTLNVIDKTATAATAALALAPQAASLSSGFTSSAAQQALNTLGQSGGGIINQDNGILPYVVIGTISLIVVSGFILTFRRISQNGDPRKNDTPPEPGVLRESNKKESSKST